MRYFRADPQVWMKDGQSPVSEADLAVDARLRDILMSARPGYGWLSEETADDPARLTCRRTFVVDPIDGTRAFIAGSRQWCVSIAIVEDGRAIVGVLDAPAKGGTYRASRGGGAWLADRALRVAPERRPIRVAGPKAMIDRAEAATGLVFDRAGYVPSLALRLAYVASGDIDAALVKVNAHDWDIAAADLLLEEAGGTLLDRAGARPHLAGADPRLGELVAGGSAARTLLPTLAADMRQ
ncbi:MAG: 3'(2'),5'-bisphosphate nucleotidase CysQ [Phyllobacteriaceae bacterium]|nr:3'(2'),5'-bisphosphate nucleotidase CysQ [Phyllobacteriaceae bacterium]